MKVGDFVLVTGTAFFEKAEIVERKKGIYTLSNGIKTDFNLNPINSKLKIEKFNEQKYAELTADGEISRAFTALKKMVDRKSISGAQKVYLATKLNKLLNKLK